METVDEMNYAVDHHIHTKYSACCRQEYDLADIISIQSKKGMKYMCVSDHIHEDKDDGGIPEHYKVLRNNPELVQNKKIFIGAELTIRTLEGDVPLLCKERKEKPQFLLGGCHTIPQFNLHMWAINDSINIMREYSENQLLKLFNSYQKMIIGACRKRNFDVLIHPLEFFIRCDLFDSRILDLFIDIAGTCRKNNIAIELNNASINRCLFPSSKYAPFNRHCIQPANFFREMIAIACNENVLFSPGSDAHHLENIGNLNAVNSILSEFGIKEDQIFFLD